MSTPRLELSAGMWFATQKACTAAVKAFATSHGKRVFIVQKGHGGVFVRYRCTGGPSCTFIVNAQRTKSESKSGYFLSTCNLDHDICLSTAKIAATQLRSLASDRALVAADHKISGKAIVGHVRTEEGAAISEKEALRGRALILNEFAGSVEFGFQRLRSLFSKWQSENPDSVARCEFGQDGAFVRAFLLNPLARNYSKHGQQVMGFDGAHLKDNRFKLTALLLVGRDGNNANIVLAVAVCSSETEKNCSWFMRLCLHAGLPVSRKPLFADRGSGLMASKVSLPLREVRYCTRHIENNIRSGFKGACPSDLKHVLYDIQRSTSDDEYKSKLAVLALTHAAVSRYIEEIKPDNWVLFSALGPHRLYGWRTTNFVEGENAAALKARRMLPFELFQHYMESFMTIAWKRREQDDRWTASGLQLTRYAHDMIKEQQRESGYCQVAPSDKSVAFVHDTRVLPKVQYQVKLSQQSCTCSYVDQHGLPCKHIVATLASYSRLDELFGMADATYRIDSYRIFYGHLAARSIRLVLQSDLDIHKDDLPPVLKPKTTGRHQERRFPSSGDVSARVGRARRTATCGKCGRSGHNRRTCSSS